MVALLTRWVAVACAALKHKNFGFEMIAVPADEFPSGGAETPPFLPVQNPTVCQDRLWTHTHEKTES